MEQELAIVADYESGMSLRKVNSKYGFNNRRKVEAILKQHNVNIRRKRKTYLFDDELIKLYNMGLSSSEISRRLKWPTMTTWEALQRLGLKCDLTRQYPPRPPDDVTRLMNTKYNFDCNDGSLRDDGRIKYTLDENYFSKIDTPNKAYLLGWFYTDGNVYESEARIELIDKDILKFMKNELKYNGPITTYQPNRKNTQLLYKLAINRNKIVKDLIDKGCYPNKSLTLKFPTYDIVPKELMNHFIRGCIEGDGTINCTKRKNKKRCVKWTAGFVGTKEMCEGILKEIDIKVDWRQRNPAKNTWTWNIQTLPDIKKLLNYIYKDAEFALGRKLVLADKCLQYIYESELL